jgi:hypothetical protein
MELAPAPPPRKVRFSTAASTVVSEVWASLGVDSLIDGQLPESWPADIMETEYVQFAWPDGMSEVQVTQDLLSHVLNQLRAFKVCMGQLGGFQMFDVRGEHNLGFTCMSGGQQLICIGGADAVVIPFGQNLWQRHLRVVFDWKTPNQLRVVGNVLPQAKMEMCGAIFKSDHPALVVFTDGSDFVILQPYLMNVRIFQTFKLTRQGPVISADDAMRLIAYHLSVLSSKEQRFVVDLADLPAESPLTPHLELVLTRKRKYSGGGAFAEQLELDAELPEGERLEAMAQTIHNWRGSLQFEPWFGMFS